MKEIFRKLLESIDSRLPQYFLVKGGRLQVVPLSIEQYNNLLSNGYEPLVKTTYDELDREILGALNEIVDKLGNKAVMLYPFAVSAIISYEAKNLQSKLGKVLRGKNAPSEAKKANVGATEDKTGSEGGEARRRRKATQADV